MDETIRYSNVVLPKCTVIGCHRFVAKQIHKNDKILFYCLFHFQKLDGIPQRIKNDNSEIPMSSKFFSSPPIPIKASRENKVKSSGNSTRENELNLLWGRFILGKEKFIGTISLANGAGNNYKLEIWQMGSGRFVGFFFENPRYIIKFTGKIRKRKNSDEILTKFSIENLK